MAQGSKLIAVFYDPDTRRIWGKGGKFVSLDEFAKYPPTAGRSGPAGKNAQSTPTWSRSRAR